MNNKINRTMNIYSQLEVLEAMEFTNQYARILGYSENEPLFLSLVVEESLINALEYGEGSEAIIEWEAQKESLVISVKQKGTPFIIEKNEEINKGSRGRGMQLILNIMDKVWLEQVEEHSIALFMEKKNHLNVQ